ncbi:MAG: protein translocase subunit SecF [Actinobacteria bacterium]|nr:protein translocase subunit SecF [Actinomycetota bacterium]
MFKIIKNSKYWFIFSGSLTILSIVAISVFGLRLGIDFKGGTVIEARSSNPDRVQIAEKIVKEEFSSNYQVKSGGNDQINLRLPVLSNEDHIKLSKNLTDALGDYKENLYDTVGPSISRDLITRSIIAVILASLAIIFYIAYAFRRVPKPLSSWKFGLSAVIALIHDLLITTGIVAIISHYATWMEVDALFVTALLTIMGFSVHDTIVVYDRLRENFIKNPHKGIAMTAEESVNQTLARSINTSLTVILVLVSLFVLGGASIRHFILILIVGIFFGTYSSIFVATAILVKWQQKKIPQAASIK